MANRWYYWDDDRAIGPVPAEQIADLIKMAALEPETMVRHGADGMWFPANEVPAISGIAAPPALGQAVLAGPPAAMPPASHPAAPRPVRDPQQSPGRTAPTRTAPTHVETPVSSPALLWGLIGGGVGLVVLLSVLIVIALKSRPTPAPTPAVNDGTIVHAPLKKPAEPLPQDSPTKVDPSAPVKMPPSAPRAETLKEATKKAPKAEPIPAKPETPMPQTPAPVEPIAGLFDFLKDRAEAPRLSGQQVYERILKSCVFILNPEGAAGSGALVDGKNRIVITNHHVVESDKSQKQPTVYVTFPRFQNGAPVTNAKSYIQALLADKTKYRAKVLHSDPTKDLAIVQLAELPENVKPLPLAKDGGKPGQAVHSVGNPGASDSFWVYTSGTVRTNPHLKKWTSGGGGRIRIHDATIIETQSPTNPGDSGGPLVNDAGELIAVTQGGNVRANAVNIFIDVSEVKALLQSKGFSWSEGAEPTGKPRPWTSADVAKLAQLLEHGNAQVRVQAATYLVDAGRQSRFALAALSKTLDDANADVRRAATLALGAVGAEGVPGLRKALRDESALVRAAAASGLAPLGADAQSAMPELLAALTDKEGDVAIRALEAVSKIGARGPKAIAALAAVPADAGPEEQRLAGLALEQGLDHFTQNPQDVAEALPALMKIFTGKSGKLKQSAGTLLTRLGPAARPVVPELVALAKIASGPEQIEILKVVAGAGDAKDKQSIVVPQALQWLEANDDKLKVGALAIFEVLGAEGRSAESAILGAYAKDRNREIRVQALKALGAVGGPAKAAAPRLVADATQFGEAPADKELHQALTSCIIKMGEPAARELLKVAVDPKYTVRIRAVDLLGLMGPAVSEVTLMPLTRLYNDVEMNPVVRERMRLALNQIRGN